MESSKTFDKIDFRGIIVLRKIYFVFYLIVIMLFSFSCTESVEEIYTYSINKAWWSDSIDANLDGFVQSKRLNFTVHLKETVQRTINARVFYKLRDASSFTFYAYLGEKTANGSGADNNYFVPVGTLNKELPKGYYDFRIEIFESNNSQTVATSASLDSSVFYSQRFEASTNDKNYSIKTWWSGQYDRNANNFWRSAKLIINVDVDAQLKKDVYCKLFYKKSLENTYQLYYEFPNFSIFGQETNDSVFYEVGTPGIELEYGIYDFKIELYEKGSKVLVAFLDESTPELNDVKFESEYDDSYYYSFSKVWWTGQTDLDNDGYSQFRKLNFEVDVDKNEQRTIFAKIYYRHPDSTDYSKYDSTANFSITGSLSTNAYSVNIGLSKAQLDSAAYDFLIAIYEPSQDSIEAFQVSRSGATDTVLAKQKFETPLGDAP